MYNQLENICNLFYKLAKLEFVHNPNLSKEQIESGRKILLEYLNQMDELERNAISNRFEYFLNGINTKNYYGEEVFEFLIMPKAREKGTDQATGIFGDRTETVYKTPQNAIDAIPKKPGYAYRGMSFEEYQNTLRTGYIGSAGTYNIGSGQKGLTFFAPDPDGAAYYASGFSPWKFKPTHNKPGVVIAIDEDYTVGPDEHPGTPEHPGVPEGELATVDLIPARAIDYVYLIIPESIDWGYINLVKRKGLSGVKVQNTGGTKHPTPAGYKIVQIV